MKTVFVILVLCVAAILLLASRKPAVQRFVRKVKINAPISKVYFHIGSLRAYNDWNPWAALEPDQTVTFSGEDGEIGSAMYWKGRKTGEGSMTLAEANGTDSVRYDLAFIKPMKGGGSAQLKLRTEGDTTEVTWDIAVNQGFPAKVMAVFMDFEKFMGPQYDAGIARLKELSEA